MRPVIRLEPYRVSSWGNLAGSLRSDLDVPEVIRRRRSVRWYTDEAVAPQAVQAILEAGRWAPSPHGRQPWRFVVLTRQETKRELAEAMAAEWEHQLTMDGQPWEIVQTRLRKSRQRLETAPVVVILCLYLEDMDTYPDADRQAAETTMAVQSLGAAAQNMLLAAYHLGIDGGWMCAPLFCPEVVIRALGLRDSLTPHALLTFGYPAVEPIRRPRQALADLVELYD